jgi:LSD1 subclass zinc finger protein
MALTTRVFDCPSCGAPLPAASDGEHVTCAACGHATVIESGGGAAVLREQASRLEAETLFATLGAPPSWSQKVAVMLVNKWLWIVGLPFMVALTLRASQIPVRAVLRLWERVSHERVVHTASPVIGWLLNTGWLAVIVIGLLVWSLLGERIDARRDLQAALASQPPKTEGGPSLCRHCGAPLEVAPGALGVRCPHCGADNLVMIPASWVAKAGKITMALQLSTHVAATRRDEGRRRLRRAALWRAPFALGVLALVSVPAYGRRTLAGWKTFRPDADADADADGTGAYLLARKIDHGVDHDIRLLPRCSARPAYLRKSRLATDDSAYCELGVCDGVAMLALARGETLRLIWSTPAPADLRLALAPIDYLGGVAVLWDSFGDEVARRSLPIGAADTTALDLPVAISGWYKLDLIGKPGPTVELCTVAAP